MKSNNIDIFIYVQSAKAERSAAMIDAIMEINGIVSANVNQFVKRLVNVSYDPKEISSGAIVKAAKTKGERVALVSM